jgi:hypothetical protein
MMRFLRFFALTGFTAIALTSCTFVSSTNLPGKTAKKIPKNICGKYALEYPGDLAALAGEGDQQTIVTLKSDRVIVESSDGTTETLLGDSLFYSMIGKQGYLSLGAAPNLSVFKVVKTGKDVYLYSMCSEEYITAEDLSQHFSKVEEIPGEPDENGEPGSPSFVVTIDDQKLDGYFKSGLPMKDPFKLVKK